MKKLIRVIVIMFISVGLSACETMYNQITNPIPWGLETDPEGTPTFKKGWADGCKTGLTVYGNDIYKAAHGWQQDTDMVLNDEYYRAWKDAYTYCRWYAFTWVRNARE